MRVWNKEINKCCNCPYFDAEYTNCNYKYNTGDTSQDMFNQCEFNKPLTKEDVLELGFEYKGTDIYGFPAYRMMKEIGINTYNKSQITLGQHNNVYLTRETEGSYENGADTLLFRINNPQELEFILRSLKIIK